MINTRPGAGACPVNSSGRGARTATPRRAGGVTYLAASLCFRLLRHHVPARLLQPLRVKSWFQGSPRGAQGRQKSSNKIQTGSAENACEVFLYLLCFLTSQQTLWKCYSQPQNFGPLTEFWGKQTHVHRPPALLQTFPTIHFPHLWLLPAAKSYARLMSLWVSQVVAW